MSRIGRSNSSVQPHPHDPHQHHLSANNDRTTTAMWEQTITALDEAGNQFVAAYTDEKYRADVVRQEKLLNHFLQTGKALPPEKW